MAQLNFNQRYSAAKQTYFITGSFFLDVVLKLVIGVFAIVVGSIVFAATKNAVLLFITTGCLYFVIIVSLRSLKRKRLLDRGAHQPPTQPVMNQQPYQPPPQQQYNQIPPNQQPPQQPPTNVQPVPPAAPVYQQPSPQPVQIRSQKTLTQISKASYRSKNEGQI